MEKKPKSDAYQDELDRFWDIDALMPQRRPIPVSRKTDTVEVTVEPSVRREDVQAVSSIPIPPRPEREEGRTVIHSVTSVSSDRPVHRYVSPPSKETMAPEYEYVPDSALIHSVRIYRWKSNYHYYEEFAETAEKLMAVKGIPAQPVKFFSYVPQYAQMTKAQFSWYLWLRECVKQESYPETDFSYLLLYAYEIINLSDRMQVAEGQRLLLRIWLNYRSMHRQLDRYLPDWICDYSLIHRLPLPQELTREQLALLMTHCTLKEFYVSGAGEDGYLHALLAFCSNYDYRKSKFYTEENQALFDSLMKTVLREVTARMSADGKLFSSSDMQDSRLTRDAYSGALCSYRMKRRIEISYCSFSRSHELRFLITDVLKHVENLLRAYLGIRSRLTIYALPNNVRDIINQVAAELLPSRRPVKKQQPVQEIPEYERLYDLPARPLDTGNASEIERASWATTQRLVEAFEEEHETPITVEEKATGPQTVIGAAAPVVPSVEPPAEQEGLAGCLMPYLAFLRACTPAQQREAAAVLGKLPDAVADEINELTAEKMGDILLEDNGNGYEIIEDYRELLEGLL